ncbi:hypothetical protein [Kribbella sp. CA-293567]
MTNLQSLCVPCHKAKTTNEAREARAEKARRGRYTEPHPGMIEPRSSS